MSEDCRWLAALRGLTRAFTYPDARWLATLLDGRWPEALAEVLSSLELPVDGLLAAIGALPGDETAALQALQVEYTYLFVNAVPHVPAPPYASAYSGQGLLMGKPAERATQAYREAGLVLAPDYHDLPDHLAAELEFLAWLGDQALAADRAGDRLTAQRWRDQRRAFLRGQVEPWLPEFARRVAGAARIPFYHALASLTVEVLAREPSGVTLR